MRQTESRKTRSCFAPPNKVYVFFEFGSKTWQAQDERSVIAVSTEPANNKMLLVRCVVRRMGLEAGDYFERMRAIRSSSPVRRE